MQCLDVLACNSANKPSFQNLQKGLFAQRSLDGKDGLLAELQAKMSRGCRFLLFWHHSYEVTLRFSYSLRKKNFGSSIVLSTLSVYVVWCISWCGGIHLGAIYSIPNYF